MRLSKFQEFETEELFDPNNIAALIDKSKEKQLLKQIKRIVLLKIALKILKTLVYL